MKNTLVRSPLAALVAAAALLLSACGGGGGGSGPPPAQPTVAGAIAAAAAQPANDTATNSSSAFKVLQDAGVPAVTVQSPPKVNFTVFSDGAVKQGLALSNMSFAIAKLVPGTNGDIDQWVNYVYRTETAAAGVGPNGTPVLATAKQATTDPKPAGQANQLVFNPAGYYTYTFSTDIKDPTKTNNVVFEPDRTHRIAIQLSYTNAAGEVVRVNPYFDVTFDANGNAVPVTDPTKTRVMTDVAQCNGCHSKLSLHGGGRVDTQFCVMCHNPGTTDANSGNVLTMQSMVHKIHAGRLLATKAGGEDYTIWGFQNGKHDYAEIGFPQDLRNCTKCHTATNPKTPQGDNWKTRPTKESCLTCHANNAGSSWDTSHAVFAGTLVGPGAAAKQLTNAMCADCHRPGSAIASERVHWNQNEENGALYKMNIDAVTFDPATRTVTIQYYVSNPSAGNAAYNLVTPDCTAAAPNVCAVLEDPTNARSPYKTKFGNLRFYLAYQTLVGQSTAVTEFTSYNNGGSAANVYAYKGTNDGSNHYTATITLPADTATVVAGGTARVISIGQVKEPLLQVKWATDPRPEVVPQTLINTIVQHTFKDVYLSGSSFNPRRQVVSSEKCNVCHGALGTTSGSNTLASAFHNSGRDIVEACALCHDANRSSTTLMTNGTTMRESYQFKRMIHGIHGNLRRIYPFTHGNAVQGAFCNPRNVLSVSPLCDPLLTLATTGVENYAAEVGWPGQNPSVSIDCTACHVNDSYKLDRSPLGAVVSALQSDPLANSVISPKAATCTACHDSPTAIAHVTSFGQAAYGSRTQAQSLLVQETCNDCHSSGGFKGVDIVHGLK